MSSREQSPRSSPRGSDSGEPELAGKRLSRLLELGIEGSGRPVDSLVARLATSDGGRWLDESLEVVFADSGSPSELLGAGHLTLERLVSAKEEAKKTLASEEGEELRLRSLAVYFLSVAAALVHHNTLISSRSAAEIEPILLDLAEVTTAPWSGLLARAAVAAAELARRKE